MRAKHPAQHWRPPVAVRLVDVDAVQDLELSRDGAPYRTAMIVGLRAGRPIGEFVVPVGHTQRIDAAQLRLVFASADHPIEPTVEPTRSPPSISVVVNTCAQPESVARAVRSVLACDPGPLEVIVVENRPIGSPVAAALAHHFGADSRVRYVEERDVGLGAARNAGLAAAQGEVIAFTDDDVVVDPTLVAVGGNGLRGGAFGRLRDGAHPAVRPRDRPTAAN